jgi:spore maturation protein CgeB
MFVGHYEDDGRDDYIKALLDSEMDFRLFGPLWERSKYCRYMLDKLGRIDYLVGDYNLALNSTKIALTFLSKLNNDSYTRRCFEIPAAGTFMLSEYTDDLNSMFKEGVEAEYFRGKQEMIDKVRYYLKHDKERERIALAGHRRVTKDGHEVTDRARTIMKVYVDNFIDGQLAKTLQKTHDCSI